MQKIYNKKVRKTWKKSFKYIAFIHYIMKEQITIWIDKDLLNEIREYSIETTDSKKALSGTISNILREKIEEVENNKRNPPIHTSKTQTHFKKTKNDNGKEEDIEEIEDIEQEFNLKGINAPKEVINIFNGIMRESPNAITVKLIEENAVEKYPGRDPRTIKKYVIGVLQVMKIVNFKNHPKNPYVLIRDPKTYFPDYEEIIKEYGEFKFIPIENLKLNKYL